MALRAMAKDTLRIIEDGGYSIPDQNIAVHLKRESDYAISNTRTIFPQESAHLLLKTKSFNPPMAKTVHFEVTPEKTHQAAKRLYSELGLKDVLLLNFASARNQGGGFINGARAQEEDLCRSSCLYYCLTSPGAAGYYHLNRKLKHVVYSDAMIYSPRVPFFRDGDMNLLSEPYFPSVLSCPAPNVVAKHRPWPEELEDDYDTCFSQRVGKMLAVAENNGHRNLVLGAWGCGVFGNNPKNVADDLYRWLTSERFAYSFDHVVFAVFDPPKVNIGFFETTFASEEWTIV